MSAVENEKPKKRRAKWPWVVAGIVVLLMIGDWRARNSPSQKQFDDSLAVMDKQFKQGQQIREEKLREVDRKPRNLSWVKIGEWSGSGPKTTETFRSENGEMRVTWKATSREGGLFGARMEGQSSASIANHQIEGTERDVSFVHESRGQYHLSVTGFNCEWNVTIEDKR